METIVKETNYFSAVRRGRNEAPLQRASFGKRALQKNVGSVSVVSAPLSTAGMKLCSVLTKNGLIVFKRGRLCRLAMRSDAAHSEAAMYVLRGRLTMKGTTGRKMGRRRMRFASAAMAMIWLAAAPQVFAGDYDDRPVILEFEADGGGHFRGSLLGTRMGSGAQRMGCTITGMPNGPTIQCAASVQGGRRGYCTVRNPPESMYYAVMNAANYGYLQVWWNKDKICTKIMGTMGSQYLPELE